MIHYSNHNKYLSQANMGKVEFYPQRHFELCVLFNCCQHLALTISAEVLSQRNSFYTIALFFICWLFIFFVRIFHIYLF